MHLPPPPPQLRSMAPGVTGRQPLVAIISRAVREQHREAREGSEREREACVELADCGHALARLARELNGADLSPALAKRAGEIEAALRKLEVEVVAPVGLPYEGRLHELLENCAQVPASPRSIP